MRKEHVHVYEYMVSGQFAPGTIRCFLFNSRLSFWTIPDLYMYFTQDDQCFVENGMS